MDAEDNLDELVEMVFSKPHQSPKSIQLQLDDGDGDGSVVPEIFAHIASRGAKRLFGVTNIMHLTEPQAQTLEKYMQSMGKTMTVTCNFCGESPFEVLAKNGEVHSVQVSFEWL